jgi:hypothetical protein
MRTGSSRILLIAFCSTFFTNLATAAGRKPADDAYAVIAGTVFRHDGFSLRGAQVTIDPDPSAKPKPRIKIRRLQADGRGEFAFRVPPGPMKYTVRAKAAGFEQDEKVLSIQATSEWTSFSRLNRCQVSNPLSGLLVQSKGGLHEP